MKKARWLYSGTTALNYTHRRKGAYSTVKLYITPPVLINGKTGLENLGISKNSDFFRALF
jgi:hypothetical protein